MGGALNAFAHFPTKWKPQKHSPRSEKFLPLGIEILVSHVDLRRETEVIKFKFDADVILANYTYLGITGGF